MDVTRWKTGDVREVAGPDEEPLYARVVYRDDDFIVEQLSRYDWTFSAAMLRSLIPGFAVEGAPDDVLCFELWMRPREKDLKGFYAEVFDRSGYLAVAPPYFWPDEAAEATGRPRMEYGTAADIDALAGIAGCGGDSAGRQR